MACSANHALVILLALFGLGTTQLSAQEMVFESNRKPVTTYTEFKCVVQFLQQMVNHRGKQGRHVLYVSQIETAAQDPFVRVYWPLDHSILMLDLQDLPCAARGQEIHSKYEWYWYDSHKARIDLGKHVVPTQNDIRGSTFLVSRPWVDKVIKDCKHTGYRLSLSSLGRSKKLSRAELQRPPSAATSKTSF